MTEMVERVANALRAGGSYEDMARAAIEAMREPTEAMREAYEAAHRKARVRSAFSLPAFRAMIDASLHEGEARR